MLSQWLQNTVNSGLPQALMNFGGTLAANSGPGLQNHGQGLGLALQSFGPGMLQGQQEAAAAQQLAGQRQSAQLWNEAFGPQQTDSDGNPLPLSPQAQQLQSAVPGTFRPLISALGQERGAAFVSQLAMMQAMSGIGGGGVTPDAIRARANAIMLTDPAGAARLLQAANGMDVQLQNQLAGGRASAEAPYRAPITFQKQNPDGSTTEMTVPVTEWAAQNGAAQNGAAPSGGMPGRNGQPQQLGFNDYYRRITASESNGVPSAKNPNSSALGPSQFIKSTWQSVAPQVIPGAANLSPEQLLALRTNPQADYLVNKAFTQQNADAIQQSGRDPTGASLALAHQLGADDAIRVLSATANTPLQSILSPKVIAANPQYANMTAGQIRAKNAMVFGESPVDFSNGTAPAPMVPRQPQQPQAPISTMTPQQPGNIPGAIPGRTTIAPMTPEQSKVSEGLGQRSQDIADTAAKAPAAQVALRTMATALQGLSTGAGTPTAVAAGRALLSGMQALGIQPSDTLTNMVSSGETVDKIGAQLQSEITRQMGSREAAVVFQNMGKRVPDLGKSPQGNQIVLQTLQQEQQRNIDLGQYREQWLADPSHHNSIAGMESSFNQQYPVDVYSSRALPFNAPSDPSKFRPGIVYIFPNGTRGMYLGNGKVETDPARMGIQ